MVRIFKTIEGAIHEIQEPQEDCWIAMTNPTATEIFEMSERFGIEVDDLRAPLDEEERSRIEVEDTYTLTYHVTDSDGNSAGPCRCSDDRGAK